MLYFPRYTHMHRHARTHTQAHRHAQTQTHTHTNIQKHAHTHAHAHTHTHTHTVCTAHIYPRRTEDTNTPRHVRTHTITHRVRTLHLYFHSNTRRSQVYPAQSGEEGLICPGSDACWVKHHCSDRPPARGTGSSGTCPAGQTLQNGQREREVYG